MVQSLENLRNAGKMAFKEHDFEKALDVYTKAIKVDQNDPVLYSNRAMSYIKLKRWNQGLQDCNYGLTLNSEKKIGVKLLWRQALCLLSLERYEEAQSSLVKALGLDPTNTVVLRYLEDVQAKISDQEKDIQVIPIKEVDHLPEGFTKPNTTQSGETIQDFDKELSAIEGVTVPKIESKPKPSLKESPKPESISLDPVAYPAHPTAYFLSTLSRKITDSNRTDYYTYILQLDPKVYQPIFKSAGVDSDFLKLYVDASLWSLKLDSPKYVGNIVDSITLFTKLPRFSLSSMFISSTATKQLLDLLKNASGVDLHTLWR